MTKGKNVIIQEGCHIGENVTIGDDVYIDYGCIIRDNVVIGDGSTIGPHCILGEYTADWYGDHSATMKPLTIGAGAVIRSDTVIYADVTIGDCLNTGHHVTIREKTVMGDHCSVGTLTDIQGNCTLGNYVRIHSDVFVGPNATIKDFAWIFPHVVITNDPTPPSECAMGVTLEEYAVVSAGSILLPGITVATDSLVAAGALVTKDVKSGEVVGGNPAKKIADIDQLKDRKTGEKSYPWRYTFDRYMPWQGIGYTEWKDGQNR